MWSELKSQAVHIAVGGGAASKHDTQVVTLFDDVPFMQAERHVHSGVKQDSIGYGPQPDSFLALQPFQTVL